jgi:hypothetical protein
MVNQAGQVMQQCRLLSLSVPLLPGLAARPCAAGPGGNARSPWEAALPPLSFPSLFPHSHILPLPHSRRRGWGGRDGRALDYPSWTRYHEKETDWPPYASVPVGLPDGRGASPFVLFVLLRGSSDARPRATKNRPRAVRWSVPLLAPRGPSSQIRAPLHCPQSGSSLARCLSRNVEICSTTVRPFVQVAT